MSFVLQTLKMNVASLQMLGFINTTEKNKRRLTIVLLISPAEREK